MSVGWWWWMTLGLAIGYVIGWLNALLFIYRRLRADRRTC